MVRNVAKYHFGDTAEIPRLGMVIAQYNRMTIMVKLFDLPTHLIRCINVKNPAVFESDPRNQFHILSLKKGRTL